MRREAIISIFLILTLVNSAYALETTSSNFDLSVIAFLQGAGAASSSNNTAVWTASGENSGSVTTLSGTQFSSQAGQLFLLVPAAKELMHWLISDLQAKTGILGPLIPEAAWQKDNDPYFYWQINIEPPELIQGFSISLDTPPDLVVDVTDTRYQFSEDSITSGKHTFYVLPYTSGKAWEQKSLLSFEIWVDVHSPMVNRLQPIPGSLTSDNRLPISCFLSDIDSGIDKSLTTLTLNEQAVAFEYDSKKETLTYQPETILSEGENTVLLKAVDAVGNSIVKAWEFIVDTQPPSGSILINGGQTVTHSAYVSINIEAQDATSGIKNIYLSNDGVFDTELNRPYPYSPLIPDWLLRDPDVNGLKSVYVKFEDAAGNISEAFKDELTLELRTPDTRIISGPASATEETEAAFVYEASKPGCLFSYKLDNLDWSNWQSANKTEFSGLTAGNHYFYVKSGFDLSGDGKITIDEEDATPAQWVWTIKPQGVLEKLRERILFWRR